MVKLKDWLKEGWLVEHACTSLEMGDSFAVIERDLKECQIDGLSPDWRLIIAYNAVFQTALAALAAEGYRVSHAGGHFYAVQSLALTLGCDKGVVAELDAFRKTRNRTDYERAHGVSMREAVEILELASALFAELLKWLTRRHPELIPRRSFLPVS